MCVCIHLAYSLGACAVRAPAVTRARSRRARPLSCSRRVLVQSARPIHLAYSLGVFTWRIHLAYSLGVFTWCVCPSFATNLYKLAFSGLGSGGDHLACRNVVTEIRCLDFVEVDATKLAWRMDMAEIRCLDSVDMDATKLAWRMDMAEIRCLDSVEVDATKLAWRIDVAEIRCSDSEEVDAWNFAWRFGVAENSKLGFRSLDSMEADATKPRIDGRMLSKIW